MPEPLGGFVERKVDVLTEESVGHSIHFLWDRFELLDTVTSIQF